MNLTEIELLILEANLIVELELEAVSTVKLLPVLGATNSKLPCPIKVLDSFYLGSYLLKEIVNFRGRPSG